MIQVGDRVADFTATVGTGAVTLAGTPTAVAQGLQSWAAAFGSGTVPTVAYLIQDATGNDWEVGIGTLTGGTTLARSYVLRSSNAGALVSFPAGNKVVASTMLAEYLNGPIGMQMRSPTALAAAAASTVNLTLDGAARNGSAVYGASNGLITISGNAGHLSIALSLKGSSGAGAWTARFSMGYLNNAGALSLTAPVLVDPVNALGSAAGLTAPAFTLTATVSGAEIVLTVTNNSGSGSETWNVWAGLHLTAGQ